MERKEQTDVTRDEREEGEEGEEGCCQVMFYEVSERGRNCPTFDW